MDLETPATAERLRDERKNVGGSVNARRKLLLLPLLLIILGLCFAGPLVKLFTYSWNSNLYSHIILIPVVSGYLLWCRRGELSLSGPRARKAALVPAAVGAAVLIAYGWGTRAGWRAETEDYLSATTLAFLLFALAAALFVVPAKTLRQAAFPIAFLAFMLPMPGFLHGAVMGFLQEFSAETAYQLLSLGGVSIYRQELTFYLPGLSMHVAPECSGIHSTLVLFITSVMAGYMFLRSPWRRMVLSAAVIPLALLRNGLRIFTLGQICTVVDPELIHSVIHKRGGPVFFAFSLLPLMLLLFALRAQEKRTLQPGQVTNMETRTESR